MNFGRQNFSLPRSKGCYVLVLLLNEVQTLTVGKLGELVFRAGYYLYVGSALGAGGLAGRLKHHLNPQKLHWHIDFLRVIAQLEEIWLREGTQIRECEWAAELTSLPCLTCPHCGFGSSDCECGSHLFYCPSREALSTARSAALKNSQIILLCPGREEVK